MNKRIAFIALISVFLIFGVVASDAATNTTKKTQKTVKKISDTENFKVNESNIKKMQIDDLKNKFKILKSKNHYKVGPKYIAWNNKYVKSVAKCSCGLKSYEHKYASFKNYCPGCKNSGTLRYEEGIYNPEGMWFCNNCDMDFCLKTGKEHISGTKYWLKKA